VKRVEGLRHKYVTKTIVLGTATLGALLYGEALLTDSINRLRRGQLDPRVANAMGYLTGVLLRALEQGAVEERLARIEATRSPAA
jgi:hypothetical protein